MSNDAIIMNYDIDTKRYKIKFEETPKNVALDKTSRLWPNLNEID